jgi:hypothetical protein
MLPSVRPCAGAVQRVRRPLPPQIQQMLLVLQSVHRTPPDARFFVLQDIVSAVVDSYLPMISRVGLKSPDAAIQGEGCGLGGIGEGCGLGGIGEGCGLGGIGEGEGCGHHK